MTVVNCIQGSPEWLQERCGRVTASELKRALKMLKSGADSQERKDYRAELIGEILSGLAADHYVSKDMERGTELEPLARAAYGIRYDVDADQVGLMVHDAMEFFSASPDGLVGSKGGIEIKVPRISTHIKWIRDGVIPEEHIDQVDGNLACSGREWWDFVSYCDLLSERYQLFVVRRYRDDKRIAEVEDGVRQFWQSVQNEISILQEKMPALEQPAPADFGELGLTDEDLKYITEEKI